MSTIVTRSGKGSPLSHVEVDANFNNLNTDKVEKTAAAITGGTINNTTIGATTPSTGKFSTLEATGTSTLGTASAQFIQAAGGATESQLSAQGSGTNIPLVLQPKGTGAIQAQATTSTTAGGNVRGANAVDWQTARGSASQVASGANSVIAGGINNTTSGTQAFVGGGNTNVSSATYTIVSGGIVNNATQQYASVIGGYSNQSTGWFNFIGNGYLNSGTANAAVTTQATTAVTSGSTAVTLSGSNAAIRVGQLITGTGINNFPNTYVAAISGTSLTLSQNATATGTPTLSFFTPHGVVVGGGNNQATGSYSFIGGGGDAGTAANRNVASGDWSVVAGGRANTASGTGAFIGGGGTTGGAIFSNLASGTGATILGGFSNTSSGTGSSVVGGFTNAANQTFTTVVGGSFGTARSIVGNTIFPSSDAPISGNLGINQAALLILARQTTDATPTALCSSAAAAGTGNQVILPNNSAYFFTGEVISGVTGGGNTKGWTIEGVIKRGANAAATTLVGTPTVTSSFADAGASTWVIAVTADTTNGGLRVTFTGQAATTIRTVARITTVEMTF